MKVDSCGAFVDLKPGCALQHPRGEGASSGTARHLPQRGRHWGGALAVRAGVGTGPHKLKM